MARRLSFTVEELLALGPGWDSYRAEPIDPKTIENGFHFYHLAKREFPEKEFYLGPTASGGVAVRTVPTRPKYVYAQFYKDGGLCVLFSDLAKEPESTDCTLQYREDRQAAIQTVFQRIKEFFDAK